MWFVVFAAQNHDAVTLTLFPLPYEVELPKFLFAFLCFLAGVLIAAVALGLKSSQEHREYKKQRRAIAAMEEELKASKAKESALLAPADSH